jgi:hypothetical protein
MTTQTPTPMQTPAKDSATSRGAYPQVRRQPDGLGKRVGQLAEITVIAQVTPGGAAKFRQNATKIQDDAWYYERLVGDVHDFRVAFINHDTQAVIAVTFDGDFKPYIQDIFTNAPDWFDEMFTGVLEGYPGSKDPGIVQYVLDRIVEAEMWYASNPDVTVKEVTKGQKVLQAFNALLDTASS